MKTDRELLELAAKAEGITLHAVGNSDGEVVFYTYPDMLFWNPLTDDGDALRLVARLNFCIDISYGAVRIVDVLDNVHYLSVVATNQEDQMKVVRRAIVSAAAAIGEAM